jgi:hypothetical protein
MSRLTRCARPRLQASRKVGGAAIAQTHGDGAAVEHVPEGPALGDPAHPPLADQQIEATALGAT